MTPRPINLLEFFDSVSLVESDLVRFLMRPRQRRLDIVVNYVAETVGKYFLHLKEGGLPGQYEVSRIDFRLLSFRDVTNFRTRLGPNVALDKTPRGKSEQDWIAHEQTLLTPRGRIITGAECVSANGTFTCRMYLDSFGEHSWDFSELIVDRKVVQVVRKGATIEYHDDRTNTPINPADPFPKEMQ